MSRVVALPPQFTGRSLWKHGLPVKGAPVAHVNDKRAALRPAPLAGTTVPAAARARQVSRGLSIADIAAPRMVRGYQPAITRVPAGIQTRGQGILGGRPAIGGANQKGGSIAILGRRTLGDAASAIAAAGGSASGAGGGGAAPAGGGAPSGGGAPGGSDGGLIPDTGIVM